MELSEDALARYTASAPGEALLARGWLGMARLHYEISRTMSTARIIADIGGGTGDIADYLLHHGATVELCDIVPEVVDIANERHHGSRFHARHASATNLPYGSQAFDASLMLGPLYHLREQSARIAALRECARITKPGGAVVVEFMGRDHFAHWATTRLWDTDSIDAALSVSRDGWFPGAKGGFTSCHTSTADELEQEAFAAGLEVTALRALQGPYWTTEIDATVTRRKAAAQLLRIATATCERDSSIAISLHAIAVLQVPLVDRNS